MKYCKKCVMPDTRPGIVFDEEGVCSACRSYEKQKTVDWDARYKELEALCDKYRGMNGPDKFDCAIAVSGGKDSHFQTYVMKELMGMNPLLISALDNLQMTEAGKHNIDNIAEEFGCTMIKVRPKAKVQKKIMRLTFENFGHPIWVCERFTYVAPFHVAINFNLPLLVYGENVSYTYGGPGAEDTYSAKKQILNGAASDIPEDLLLSTGITKADLELYTMPPVEQLEKLEPIYMSYFLPWNSHKNYLFARSRGFHTLTHEWEATHHIEHYNQVDSYAYSLNGWMRYPKFGHQYTTDFASRYVRYGMITRDEAIALVQKHDHDLDPKTVETFCEFVGYSESEFWQIVEKHYNKDLFYKDDWGRWIPKYPIWKA